MINDEILSLCMNLIMHSGDAKSSAIEAIQLARKGDFSAAKEKLSNADESSLRAHEVQTMLLTREASGEIFQGSILLTHAQDHLMTSMTTLDLAREIVMLWEFTHRLKEDN